MDHLNLLRRKSLDGECDSSTTSSYEIIGIVMISCKLFSCNCRILRFSN